MIKPAKQVDKIILTEAQIEEELQAVERVSLYIPLSSARLLT